MRQFWVKNAKGQIFDMNREDAFFSDPRGLGISRKTTYDQVGFSYREKECVLSQKKPYGNMIFDGYEQYDEFLKVIQFTPLTLMYQPLNTMYFMDVNTFTIEKNEISHKDGFLSCKVVFDGITPWYEVKKVEKSVVESTGKKYVYSYPYIYLDSQSGEVELFNGSGINAYCKIKINGPVVNPMWKLVRGEEVLTDGRVFLEIKKDFSLVVNSDPMNLEIAEYDSLNQIVNDRYEDSDFSTNRFILIPPGRSKLKISHEGMGEISFLIEVMEFAG